MGLLMRWQGCSPYCGYLTTTYHYYICLKACWPDDQGWRVTPYL